MSILSQIIAYSPNKIDTETKARAMVQGPQNMADGGRIPFSDGLTVKQQQKVIEAFPNTQFDFKKYPKYGVKKYLTDKVGPVDDRKTNKDYTKVDRFKKKGFTLEMGKGKNTRGEKYSKEGKRLSIADQNKIKATFELPKGVKEWDFSKPDQKYGFKPDTLEKKNIANRMAQKVANKNPWTLAADFGSAKGWMLAQMERVYKNESKKKINKLTYKPIYEEINGVNRIIGFKDNTLAGKGKTYYGLDKYTKKNAGDWTKHGDYKQNLKLIDISKRSGNAPNEVIMGLLKDRNFKGNNIKLNHLIHFLSGTNETSKEILKNAIVRHHNSGVAFGSATNDLSLTTQIINKRIVEAEKRIRANNILPEDVQLLKNNNVYVRSGDGNLYGSGKKSAIGQFKQIESDVARSLESGVDFKGKKFETKQLLSYLEKLGCGKSAGGRIMFGEGTSCAIKGREVLEKGLKNGFKNADAGLAQKILGTGKFLKDAVSLRGLLGPAALAFTAAAEAGIVGYDMLASGKSFREAVGDSVFNYMLGDKTKIDSVEERNKRMIEEGMTPEQMGKIGAMESALEELNTFGSQFKKLDAIQKNRDAINMSPEDTFNKNAFQLDLDRQENKARENIQDFNRTGGPQRIQDIDYAGGFENLAEGLRKNELAQLQSVNNPLEGRLSEEKRSARIRELMLQNPDVRYYMDSYPTNYGFMEGGIASLNVKK